MPLDPNWFYSTLAQSTAAIVGLAGGFLAQRVVAQRGDLSGERTKLRGEIEALQNLIDDTRVTMPQIINSMNDSLPVVEEAKQSNWQDVTLQRALLTTFSHGRGYASDGEETWPTEVAERYLTDTRDAAAALLEVLPTHTDDLIDRVQDRGTIGDGGHPWLREPPGEFPIDGINFDNVYRWMPFQRAQAQQRFREMDQSAELLATKVHQLQAKLLPRSLSVLLGILTSLLLAGVIAPMFFLSAKDDASRPLLMVFFIPLSLAFLGYLAFELRRLGQAGDLKHDF